MSSAASPAPSRTWSFPAKTTIDLTALTVMTWLGFVIVVSGISYAIHRWGTLEQSIWDDVHQLVPWFVLFLGVHVGSELLPMYVANGKTRRDFFIESSIFIAVISAFGALLILAGWLVERVLYRYLDVEQTVGGTSLYDSARDYGMITLEGVIVLSIWTLAGFMCAVAWYREAHLVVAGIIASIVVLVLVENALGSERGPITALTNVVFDLDQPPLLVILGIAAAGLLALGALAWCAIRDIPIRNVSA